MSAFELNETEFLKHYLANPPQFMWLFGAGISRTAGMPTATDLIWDLKIKLYCRQENQVLSDHDTNNDVVKARIQKYMDSKGYPALWSADEYTFYFKETFGSNYDLQQKYLLEKLNPDKISLSIGHRALAALMALGRTRVIFTTNFDGVIEEAYSKVTGANLTPYHLEGSYAALEALNQEQYPIYAKIHGDFRYQSVKNLHEDLLSNDEEVQKCFLAAATRFGIVISGYSGRDQNVMEMLTKALDQNNAFPFGIFWTVTSAKEIPQSVSDFIVNARARNISAHIIETGTFDSLLSKIWRQIPDKPSELDSKVRTALVQEVKIPLPNTGNGFPIIRMNAVPIAEVPNQCALLRTKLSLSVRDVKDLLLTKKSDSIITKEAEIFGWGQIAEMTKVFGADQIESISTHVIDSPKDAIFSSKLIHAFYERALVVGLCTNKPIQLRNDKGFVIVVNPLEAQNPLFQPLYDALSDKYSNKIEITGNVPKHYGVTWSEAIKVRIEYRNGNLYLMIKPTIWIDPKDERRKHLEFIRSKILKRYNSKMNDILNAWIKILLGQINTDAEIVCYENSEFPATFRLNTRTAYSQK